MQDKEMILSREGRSPTEQALLSRLWPKARSLALRRCAATLSRLRAGDGAFYGADDFLQDLFIEFAGLVERWRAKTEPREADLWDAWQRMLWGGGIRVLRRTSQRLWSGAEWTIDPSRLALDEGYLQGSRDRRAGSAGLCLPKSAISELTQPETAGASGEGLETLDELEAALFALRPLQRQVIFMCAMEAMPAAEVASCLGLSGRNSVYQRLSAARATLRERMGRR